MIDEETIIRINRLEAELNSLKSKLAVLEDRADARPDDTAPAAILDLEEHVAELDAAVSLMQNSSYTTLGRPSPEPPRPFDVFYDEGEGKYYVFAPDGCVLVNGVAVEITDSSNGNVELDLDPEDMPEYLYAHVKYRFGGFAVEFDGDGDTDGDAFTVAVVRFGNDDDGRSSYSLVSSAISLTMPQPTLSFEPIFDSDGLLYSVGSGLFPYGRNFYNGVTGIDDGAKVSTGTIGLHIVHSASSSADPSATVIKISDNPSDALNTNLGYTDVPLYYIENSKVKYDYRCAMSLALRE